MGNGHHASHKQNHTQTSDAMGIYHANGAGHRGNKEELASGQSLGRFGGLEYHRGIYQLPITKIVKDTGKDIPGFGLGVLGPTPTYRQWSWLCT